MIAHIYDPNIYTKLIVWDVEDPHEFAGIIEDAIGVWTDLTGYGKALLSDPLVEIYLTADDMFAEYIIEKRKRKTFIKYT